LRDPVEKPVGSRPWPCLGILAVWLLIPAPLWAAPAPVVAWSATHYNPSPLPDDLVLPLPCGGALAFRPVATPAESPRTRLVGPFAEPAGTAQRHLLIGKYEVTVQQYQAVTTQAAGQACPAVPGLTQTTRMAAQVGVSRIDAVNFAAQLSRWLQANAVRLPACEADARPCLPRVDGKPAFVRLPMDLEWEYAARGGAAVTDEVFARPRYPMPEGLDRHAWYNRNSDGEIAPIGRRLPNPLGLYDLYGNAWEVMNDPYSSTQFPGQTGGDVLMGGGIHSADEDLRVDARVEVQPYDAAGDVTTADTGFRVVLAVPVVTSAARPPVPTSASTPSVTTIRPQLPVALEPPRSPASQRVPVAPHEEPVAESPSAAQSETPYDAPVVPLSSDAPPATPPPTLHDRLRDGSPGPTLVALNGGSFRMGQNSMGGSDNGPEHEVLLASFLIGAYEITFQQYDRFVRATGRRFPDDFGWGRGERPVVSVSWSDAQAYADWLTRQTGKRYRLPSEAEWEFAAQAGTRSAYPWGFGMEPGRANCTDCGSQWDNRSTAPVGSFAPNTFGLYDTAGNALEWVADCYTAGYDGAPTDGRPHADGDCANRVARGGAYNKSAPFLKTIARAKFVPETRLNSLGFRVVRQP